MAGTYDPYLKKDLDWVRYYTVDTTEPFRVPDATIEAALRDHPNKWLAAAELFRQTVSRITNDGVVTKILDDMQITFGGKSEAITIEGHSDWLQERGTLELLPTKAKVFEVL